MKKASYEFEFLRDRLKKIAHLLLKEEYIEVSFMLGCLHSICHDNIDHFKEKNDENVS